eukprot:tig00000448_g920.t1
MTSSPDAYSYSALSYSGPHTREELDKLRQDLVKLFYPKASENYTWQQWQEVLAEVHSRKDLIPGDRWITSKLVDEMSSHAFTEADALQPRDGRLGFKEFVRYASAGVDEIATHINFEEISHPDPTGAADAAGHGDYDQSGPEPSPPPAPAPAPALAPAPEAAPAPAEDEEEVGAEGDEGEEKREGDDENVHGGPPGSQARLTGRAGGGVQGRPWLVEPTDERLPTEHAPSPTGHGQIHLRAGPASLYDAADEAEGAEESGAGGDPAVDGFFGL